MKYKGVIFDLDGTLVNSIDDLADSMNSVLQQNNFPTHGIDAYKLFVGNGVKKLVVRALPEGHRDEATVAKCFDMMTEIYGRNCTAKSKPYDGICDLLDELTKRGMKLAVLSNKTDALTKEVVAQLFPNNPFEYVVGFTTDELKKPNPQCALEICHNLGFTPSDMLYVGDSGTDMQTATNANMLAVGVLWGFRTQEELLKNGAKQLIKHPTDLIQLL
ncbi:phosphoglycolate phosphatase [Tenuifilaceae bacterium CYCD]|nr:phosphoglycolate phosphatase [Tenuifilaceae bacterium CYCD]